MQLIITHRLVSVFLKIGTADIPGLDIGILKRIVFYHFRIKPAIRSTVNILIKQTIQAVTELFFNLVTVHCQRIQAVVRVTSHHCPDLLLLKRIRIDTEIFEISLIQGIPIVGSADVGIKACAKIADTPLKGLRPHLFPVDITGHTVRLQHNGIMRPFSAVNGSTHLDG